MEKLAPKDTTDGKYKPDPTLIPYDVIQKYMIPAYEEGLIKYYRESWRKGFKVSTMIAAALRHITAFFWGKQDIDPDSQTKKHHLAGAIFSLICVLHTLDTKPQLDDRGKDYGPDTKRN